MTDKPQPDEAAVEAQRERLATTTGIEAAMTGYGRVLAEVRDFESRLDRLFERLDEARSQARERAGVELTPTLSKAMNAGYAAWLARREAGPDAGAPRALVAADEHEARRMIGDAPAADAPAYIETDGTLVLPDGEPPFDGEAVDGVGGWPLQGE